MLVDETKRLCVQMKMTAVWCCLSGKPVVIRLKRLSVADKDDCIVVVACQAKPMMIQLMRSRDCCMQVRLQCEWLLVRQTGG